MSAKNPASNDSSRERQDTAVGPSSGPSTPDRLRNYLVPRECPRVTYYAGGETTPADVERLLGSSPAVVAVESGWLERLRSCRLYSYHLRRKRSSALTNAPATL